MNDLVFLAVIAYIGFGFYLAASKRRLIEHIGLAMLFVVPISIFAILGLGAINMIGAGDQRGYLVFIFAAAIALMMIAMNWINRMLRAVG